MSLLERTKFRLKNLGLSPVKHKGQNFLIEEETLDYIASLVTEKKVVEIGPGIGNLTEALLKKKHSIVAVEMDEKLASILESDYADMLDLEIVRGSILDFDETTVKGTYGAVGNIPYYITGPIINKFLLSSNPPKEIILTIQKEVGERMVASPPKASFLSVMLSLLATVELGRVISPTQFWPSPKVSSVVVIIKPKKFGEKELAIVKLVRAGFRKPRKTLRNNLISENVADEAGLDKLFKKLKLKEKARAHELTLDEWEKLYDVLNP